MQKKPFYKLLALYPVFATLLLTLPSQRWAMFIPANQASPDRQADLGAIQKSLESTVVNIVVVVLQATGHSVIINK